MALELRPSQLIALERLTEPGRHFGALWAEPRSGKTAVALHWLQHAQPDVAVIVGPKIAEGTWRTEAARWLTCTYRFFPLTAGNEYPSPSMFRGMTLLFVNYDQFGKAPFKRLRPFLSILSAGIQGQGAMLLDESHMIKTPSSVMGRNIRPLAKQWHYRLLITGTPVTNPNQIDAVYGQWTFLDPDIRGKWASARDFREHFGEWTTVKGFPELIRPRNQYELSRYLQPNVVTMVGPGDPVPIRRVRYTVPAGVMALHKTLLKEGLVEVDGHTALGLNPLTRLLRMRTLVAGWLKDENGISFTVRDAARARLGVLGRVLGRCNGKTIIACTHLHEVRQVARYLRLKGVGHLVITGATPNKNHVIESFQQDHEARVLLVQPRTVAMAVDISVANALIWYSSDFNYVTFKQASDRIKLSPASPKVWFLCGRDTVDEDVWTTLQEDHQHLRKVVSRIRRD